MRLIFLAPLAVAIGCVLLLIASDVRRRWKLLAAGTLLLSLAFQFVPALHMHFLVPLLMQVGLALALLVHHRAGTGARL